MTVNLASIRSIVDKLIEAEEGECEEGLEFPHSEELEAVEDGRARVEEVPCLERLKALLMVSGDSEVAAELVGNGFGDLYLLISLNESRSPRYKELVTQVLGNTALSCPTAPDSTQDIIATLCSQALSPDLPLAAASLTALHSILSTPHSTATALRTYLHEHPSLLPTILFRHIPHPVPRPSALNLLYTYIYTTPTASHTLFSAAPIDTWCSLILQVFLDDRNKGRLTNMKDAVAVLDLLKQLDAGHDEVAKVATECAEVIRQLDESE